MASKKHRKKLKRVHVRNRLSEIKGYKIDKLKMFVIIQCTEEMGKYPKYESPKNAKFVESTNEQWSHQRDLLNYGKNK